jgi:hypothetical protein
MAKPNPLHVSVSHTIAAPADVVYDLISDITRMAEFSPENTGGSWLGGATGPAVGAKFKGTNAIGRTTWSTKPTVTVAERGRVFEFKVPGKSGPTWRYELTPMGGGTKVVESMSQQKPSPLPIRVIQRRAGVTDRASNLRDGMTTTLYRLADAAERQSAAV